MIDRIITGDLGVNTYLFNYSDKNVIIIDPGSDSEIIINEIRSKGYNPKAIFLTHGHFDHIGAINDLKDEFKLKVYIHISDSTFLGKEGKARHLEMFSSMGDNGLFYFKNYYKDIASGDVLFDSGDVFDEFGLEIIHTPGHSPGSSCFYSIKKSIVFTGDTMFRGGMGRTDFIGGNYKELIQSLNLLKQLPKNTIVYPGHGDKSTIELES